MTLITLVSSKLDKKKFWNVLSHEQKLLLFRKYSGGFFPVEFVDEYLRDPHTSRCFDEFLRVDGYEVVK